MESRTVLLLLGLVILAAKQGLGAATGTRSPLFSPPAPEKAGRCPPGRDQDMHPSKLHCLLDASCPGSEKCCNVGRMRVCAQPAMVGAGYCPKLCSAVEEPCLVSCLDDTWCGPGEKCCRNDCHVRCVAAESARPGLCPRKQASPTGLPCANQCDDDRSCLQGRKCCFTGCGLECVSPLAEQPAACPLDTTTPADGLCSGAELSSGESCSQEEACAKPNLAKPGACPILLRGSLGPCSEVTLKNCSHDVDCEEAKKCCWTGCRYDCLAPEEAHPGTCPPRATENGTSHCVSFCVRDNDCAKHEKCCWRRCGLSCIAAVPDGPATEPLRAEDLTEHGNRRLQTIEPLQKKTKKKPKAPSEESHVGRTPAEPV